VESLLDEKEVSCSKQEYRFERVKTLVLTVGSPLNFHRSFRTLFSFE
jgi:hypothetical protein